MFRWLQHMMHRKFSIHSAMAGVEFDTVPVLVGEDIADRNQDLAEECLDTIDFAALNVYDADGDVQTFIDLASFLTKEQEVVYFRDATLAERACARERDAHIEGLNRSLEAFQSVVNNNAVLLTDQADLLHEQAQVITELRRDLDQALRQHSYRNQHLNRAVAHAKGK